ncbi:lysophospholipase catalytic domain-containing protein [Massariosphaeria phaeospora]|uniref:Lysophospholipase n=1 Tax=Massariosphaeria phaeospora TaxID=100035 RepID=A0A7C8IER2_9PLEO|nr:lysophospholipase catalytic domain-containing protein [Massariosphaeria phaeospora]
MKTPPILVASAFACLANSSAILPRDNGAQSATDAFEGWKRASPQGPNGYAPANVDCPSTRPSIRVASGLSDEESAWLEKRRANTVQPLRELLTRINIRGFDAGQYIDRHRDNATALPNVGIAFSGGGYRAMLNGAGALAAFDSRTPGSTGAGHIGGLLQASTYIAGLSGGGWLVGSIYANNFTSVQNTIDQNDDGDVWGLGNSILQGPKTGSVQILSTTDYYKHIFESVSTKSDAPGVFNTSLTDYWGRALSFQLINATDGGPGYTFSSIQDDDDFKNGNAPMPFLVADERYPGQREISLSTTNVEFNPFEMGSFDPTLYGFVPMKYLGSNFTDGELPDGQSCTAGLDNLGFIMGTSSSLFNTAILQLETIDGVPDVLKKALTNVLNTIGQQNNDVADYTPNPFKGFHSGSNPSAADDSLALVDGGLDGQNIPLNPLIQPARAVDVIFAIDSSADFWAPTTSAENWPNGTSLVATYERTTNETMQNGTAFPYIPDTNTFINLGMNNRPAFFGCDVKNLTGEGVGPMVVYVPNSPYVYNSNTTTFQMSYNTTERNAMIQNGYNVATQGNATRANGEDWPTCLGCAILSRSFDRNGETVPDACQQCFTKYCWNGTLASQTPPPYFPQMVFGAVNVKSDVGRFVPNLLGFALAAALSGYLML